MKDEWKNVLVFDGNNGKNVPVRTLKKAMLESGIKYECFDCCLSSWEGKKLSLRVYHRDQLVLNNIKQNLCFLCPNCHSQKPREIRRSSVKNKSLNQRAINDIHFIEDQRFMAALSNYS